MKKLNEKEMNLVNGGLHTGSGRVTMDDVIKKEQREWMAKEMKKLQGLADLRMRAADDALKAAMRIDRQEAAIKEAMKAQREALGLN